MILPLIFTRSKLRARLLQLFFSHPEKEYFLRELERILSKPVAYIRRELTNLERTGLFISEKKGKEKYFRLNLKYPLYEEVKSMVDKTIGLEGSIKNTLKNLENIKLAFIFGSYAQKETDWLSDIDLMIIGKPDEDALVAEISKLEETLSREINYHIYSLEDWKKKIKEKNSFIKNVLRKPKIFLIGDESELSRLN
jgi:predicted nucleotidyltransferase